MTLRPELVWRAVLDMICGTSGAVDQWRPLEPTCLTGGGHATLPRALCSAEAGRPPPGLLYRRQPRGGGKRGRGRCSLVGYVGFAVSSVAGDTRAALAIQVGHPHRSAMMIARQRKHAK